MRHRSPHERLHALDRPMGGCRSTLLLGRRRIELEGLDRELAASLARRWGGFFTAEATTAPVTSVRFFRAGPELWVERWSPGEHYRIEALGDADRRLVASYHFAVAATGGNTEWRVGVTDEPEEPRGRIVENALRFIAAHLALDDGGFALHAAGVLCRGRAHLLAGPSGSGKSTAARRVAGGASLGDDFGVVVKGDAGWLSPALPFDNSERVQDRPCSGLYPVAGVWRLHQAEVTRVDAAEGPLGTAALVACAAFPWTMPERAAELLDHVRRFVAERRFHHLYFSREGDLGRYLAAQAPAAD